MRETLSANGISKRYSGVTVLDSVDLDIRSGEVHALIGENGAGKSTLIKILSGDIQADSCKIDVRGKPVRFKSPTDARACGIVTIFQELAIVPEMTVAENIVLGAQPTVDRWGQVISRRKSNAKARIILDKLLGSAELDAERQASTLSTAEQQVVEVARALAFDAPIIIMDEPTASLSAREADSLLTIVRQLADEGRSILFVSHRLDEVKRIADRVTVLRGGTKIGTYSSTEKSTDDLIELMVGRPISQLFPPRNRRVGDVVLKVENLTCKNKFNDVSFELREGEVLGFAGLVGAGRTDLMRAIFGLEKVDSGTVTLDDLLLDKRDPAKSISVGFGFVPEDRKEEGLVLPLTARENVVLAAPKEVDRRGLIDWARIMTRTNNVANEMTIRGPLDLPVSGLSGGNQQKVVIGKWILARSRILILDEPTRGIDVGAKAEVYRLIHQLAAEGASVIIVSSELPELINVAHRIVVMSGGKIEGLFHEEEFVEEEILRCAFRAHLGHASGDAA